MSHLSPTVYIGCFNQLSLASLPLLEKNNKIMEKVEHECAEGEMCVCVVYIFKYMCACVSLHTGECANVRLTCV